jgi:hypothetical protein
MPRAKGFCIGLYGFCCNSYIDTEFTRQTSLLVQTAVSIIYKRTRLVQTSWNISYLVRFLVYKNPYDLVCTAVQTVNWQTTGHTASETKELSVRRL